MLHAHVRRVQMEAKLDSEHLLIDPTRRRLLLLHLLQSTGMLMPMRIDGTSLAKQHTIPYESTIIVPRHIYYTD